MDIKKMKRHLGDDIDKESIRKMDTDSVNTVYESNEYIIKVRNEFNGHAVSLQNELCKKSFAPPAVDVVQASGKFFYVEKKLPVVQRALTEEDFRRLGAILASIHNLKGSVSDKSDKYDRNIDLEPAAPGLKGYYDKKRQQYALRFERASVDHSKAKTIFTHRDFTLQNVLVTNKTVYLTDFEYAGDYLLSIELLRFCVDAISKGCFFGVEPFLWSYYNHSDTFPNTDYAYDIYHHYLLSSSFPFDRGFNRDTKVKLVNQRLQRLSTLASSEHFIRMLLETIGGSE